METILRDLIQNMVAQGITEKILFVLIILFFAGLPYTVRIWREIFTVKHYLEARKLQLEILKTYTELCHTCDQLGTAEIKDMASSVINDPRFQSLIPTAEYGRQSVKKGFLQLVMALALLGLFLTGLVMTLIPILFMAIYDLPVLVVLWLCGIAIFVLMTKITNDEVGKSFSAFLIGLISPHALLILLIPISMIIALGSWLIEQLSIEPSYLKPN
jgi:hypothetical protein